MKYPVKGPITKSKVYDEGNDLVAEIKQSLINANITKIINKNKTTYKIKKEEDTLHIYQDNKVIAKAYYHYDEKTQSKLLYCIKLPRVDYIEMGYDDQSIFLKQNQNRSVDIYLKKELIGQLTHMLTLHSYIEILNQSVFTNQLFIVFYVLGHYMVYEDSVQIV